jgi:hypothetical protein
VSVTSQSETPNGDPDAVWRRPDGGEGAASATGTGPGGSGVGPDSRSEPEPAGGAGKGKPGATPGVFRPAGGHTTPWTPDLKPSKPETVRPFEPAARIHPPELKRATVSRRPAGSVPKYFGPPPTIPPPAGWQPPFVVQPAPPREMPAQDHAGLDAQEQSAKTITYGVGMVAGAILLIVMCALCSRFLF